MDVVFNHNTIGDILLAEPALRHWSELNGERIRFACVGPARELYDGHGSIDLVGMGEVCPEAVYLNAKHAWLKALSECRHFTDSYYIQLGLDPDAFPYWERKPRFTGFPFNEIPLPKEDFVCIVPRSANCRSLLSPGSPPNKNAPSGWWDELVQALPLPSLQLGADGDPVIPGATPFLGHSLREVAERLAVCRLALMVETGMGVIAGAVNAPVLYLSAASPFWLVDPKSEAPTDHILSGDPPEWRVEEAARLASKILET